MAGTTPENVDSEIGHAKINLALHVRERLPNGYHDIETIFAFLDCGDVLTVQESSDISLSIIGSFASELNVHDNLVVDAARLLRERLGKDVGAHITLDKHLPIASGIGGGSADAAATLRLLNRFWRVGYSIPELAEISKPLGADVPACVLSTTAIGKGIGQILSSVEDGKLSQKYALLVNPLVPISTAEIFEQWDGKDRGGLSDGNVMALAKSGRNDLQQAAKKIVPVIDDLVASLKQTEPDIARMSGSGATCFALYPTRDLAEKAKLSIVATYPDAWTMIGKLR